MWRKVTRFIKILILFTGVIFLGVVISVYIYKDSITRQLIQEANNYINTPIRVEGVDLNLFDKFPSLAVSFSGVFIEESWVESNDPLLISDKIFLTLNPIQLLKGTIEVNQLHIEDAELFIRVNEQSENNFTIFSKSKNKDAKDSLVIDLKRIGLKNTIIHYQDLANYQNHKYYTENLQASLFFANEDYEIKADGDLKSELIRIRGTEYARSRNTRLSAQMRYNPEEKLLTIAPSQIFIHNSEFSVEGNIKAGEGSHIDLQIKGVNSNIQTLVSLLPEDQIKNLSDYRSAGDVYFFMNLQGFTKEKVAVVAEFGLNNAEISHPKLTSRGTNINLKGIFRAPSFTELQNSSLELTGIRGAFGDYPFEGDLTMNNFDDPVAKFVLKGTFEIEEILGMFPKSRISSGTGSIDCELSFSGRINDLKSRYTSQKVTTSGEIKFNNVHLEFDQNFPLPTTINGDFVFSKNDLAINEASITTGQSNWTMKGYFRNILPFFLFENQYIGVEADIKAPYVNISDLLPPDTNQNEDQIEFGIYPNLIVDFNCDVDELSYKRFQAQNLSGDLRVKDSKIFAQNIDFESMGGQLKFSGLVNASGDNISITSTSHWENLSIDSVFYVFNNFNQDWLVVENLKGKAFADVMTDMTFTRNLNFLADSLIADISISIEGGELNNFQPMIDLEKYVDGEDLSHLEFSELRNDIHVENRRILLPQMEVRSNVSNILVSGSHTFNQEIDYRVVVPLKTLNRNRNEDMFGAVEEDDSGSKLHLKIIGTTKDYEIKYDTEGVKNKVIADLKKEVNELKEAFRKKENKEVEVVLNEEEFFEWEEDTLNIPRPRLLPH